MEFKIFGKVASISVCGGTNEALVVLMFPSCAGPSGHALRIPLADLRKENLVPGDEFRMDLTRTGFGVP